MYLLLKSLQLENGKRGDNKIRHKALNLLDSKKDQYDFSTELNFWNFKLFRFTLPPGLFDQLIRIRFYQESEDEQTTGLNKISPAISSLEIKSKARFEFEFWPLVIWGNDEYFDRIWSVKSTECLQYACNMG